MKHISIKRPYIMPSMTVYELSVESTLLTASTGLYNEDTTIQYARDRDDDWFE